MEKYDYFIYKSFLRYFLKHISIRIKIGLKYKQDMNIYFRNLVMKRYLIFLLISVVFNVNAQGIPDRESFKKCRKEFSKKICMSDEDGDGVLFYLDHCVKESGAAENNGCIWPNSDGDGVLDKDDGCPSVAGSDENNGCPWPDTDSDGILDKDDACPTVPGIKEENGCPGRKLDCTQFYEDEKKKFEKFREDNSTIENIYNILTGNLIKYFAEKNKDIKVDLVHLKFMDYGPSCVYYPINYVPTCTSNRKTDEYNFLLTKFWSKKALENFVKKNNLAVSLRYPFKEYDNSFSPVLSEELHNYLKSNSAGITSYIFPKGKGKVKGNAVTIVIEIRFLSPQILEITYTPSSGGLYPVSKKLEYSNGKWSDLKV